MSGFSSYLDNKVLDHIFKGTTYATPTKYLAIFTSGDGLTENNSGTWSKNELSTTTDKAYHRIPLANSTFDTAANSATINNVNYEFPVAESDWGTVSHVAIMDAQTKGNVLAWGAIRNPVTLAEQPREILTGDQFIVRRETMVIRLNDHPTI